MPGISGSMVLMIMGFYNPLMDTIKGFLSSVLLAMGINSSFDFGGNFCDLGIVYNVGNFRPILREFSIAYGGNCAKTLCFWRTFHAHRHNAIRNCNWVHFSNRNRIFARCSALVERQT